MNDNTRSRRTNHRLASHQAGARSADALAPRGIADFPSIADVPPARLASRRLDRLIAATAPGLALLSPRSALAAAGVLGLRRAQLAAAPAGKPGASASWPADGTRS
jgi:hypothetical protein